MPRNRERGPLGRPINSQARDARRKRILEGARRCVAERGFHAASTAEIARAAGVSVANLYQYFPSKRDLILAIVAEDLETDLAHGSAFLGEGDFVSRLEAFFRSLAAEARSPGAYRLRLEILAESQRDRAVRDAVVAMDAKLTRKLARFLVDERAAGRIEGEFDADSMARLIMRMTDGLYVGVGAGMVDAEIMIREFGQVARRAFVESARSGGEVPGRAVP
jgi:TetR/AcrR family transcriptional regulator, repressor for uid operon